MDNLETENTKSRAVETAEDIAERAGMNKERLRGTAREWAGKAERTYGQIKSKASQAGEELSGRYSDLADRANDTWEQTLELIQENPGAAIGVSVLVGAGLGALIAYLVKD